MNRTIPDNNVLIYGLVGASEHQNDEEEASENYLTEVEEGREEAFLINLIENEFLGVFWDQMSDAMELAKEAEQSSWKKAKDKSSLDDNFQEALKKVIDLNEPVKSFNEWRSKILNTLEDLKNSPSMKYPHVPQDPDTSEKNCLLKNIYRKPAESDDDLDNDVRIAFKVFQLSERWGRDNTILSCDKNMYKTNFNDLEACIDLSNYSNVVNGKKVTDYM